MTTAPVRVFLVPTETELAALREGASGSWYGCSIERRLDLAVAFMAAAFEGGSAVEVVAVESWRVPTHNLLVRRRDTQLPPDPGWRR
jgi:hypothetical protein